MNLKKKIEILGAEVPLLLVIGALVAVPASAALLSYYGTISGTATVDQSVLVDGKDTTEMPITATYDSSTYTAGDTVVEGPHSLTNNADVPATVEFVTTCENSTGSSGYGDGEGCEGITTSYQILTAPFAKDGWEAAFSDDTAHSGSRSVKLSLLPSGAGPKVAGVMVPIEPTTLDAVSPGSFYMSGDGTGYTQTDGSEGHHKRWFNYQLVVDLGPGAPHGRFVNFPLGVSIQDVPADWTEITTTGSIGPVSFFDDTLLSDVIGEPSEPDSLSSWDAKLDAEGYGDYKVVMVKVQVWGGREATEYTQEAYIDDVTVGGETLDLENGTLPSVGLSDFGFTTEDKEITLPTEGETYDFQITNDFAINLVPDDYTITTSVAPAA